VTCTYWWICSVEWLALLVGLVVALNIWDRRYTSTLSPKEWAELDEEINRDIQNYLVT
jgi:hypothetical protein